MRASRPVGSRMSLPPTVLSFMYSWESRGRLRGHRGIMGQEGGWRAQGAEEGGGRGWSKTCTRACCACPPISF